jgi:biopolymer transport protein ExbB
MNPIEIFLSGGPVMYPLLAILIAAVIFTINRFMVYGQAGNVAVGLTDEVVDLVKKGREGDALRRAEEVPGPVAAVLATVLRNRNVPIEDVEREVEVTGEEYLIQLERFLPALDTFTTLSPLLGLLGTILGMVRVFQQFTAAANDEGAKQKILAGVGEALYATAFGIFIAICCFAVYNYFAARERAISIATQQAATRLIAVLHEQQAAAATTVRR